MGRWAVAIITVACAVGAFFTASITSGLIALALVSYQGIVQLAPTLFFGIFWKRGTASAALAAMTSGFLTAAVLQVLYPVSIPWLGGLTSGVAALAVNVGAYLAVTLAKPHAPAEQARIDQLWRVHRAEGPTSMEEVHV